ncbi:rRNA pseudouridine synthase [bacterium]|nr:rRNA pseudouridine synthase [bacterium]
MQLNKFLALCGVASRRKSNDLIGEGRISVNGIRVEKPGMQVDPDADAVQVDGRRLTLPRHYVYVLLNKPADVITTAEDGYGRRTVLDLIDSDERLFPVGRLDMDTEGVLLITNDGDLAYRLTHPKFRIEKIYQARVKGLIKEDGILKLRQGVEIDPGVTVSGEARILETRQKYSEVEIRIHQGKKRQVKRMMKAVGHPVMRLNRVSFAGLRVQSLAPGKYRHLTAGEVDALYGMTGLCRQNTEKDHE